MKLLESTRFEAINNALFIQTGDSKIIGRIESYSCKMAGGDKALYKRFNAEGVHPNDLQALSPPQGVSPGYSQYSRSTSGDEEDYDFMDVKSHEFSKEPSRQWVSNAIDTNLAATAGEQYRLLGPSIWTAIDDEISLENCDIYSYNPDLASDPFGEDGCLWSFNYFFYNKKLKRIVFFTCRAINPRYTLDSGFGSDFIMDEDESY
ncbi:hypothetical protein JTB14_017099 [Gonioctena quinquepunctata]|nr:hypothetical protein JTB14_017099 [Gonioctena quinquepunctata]